MSEWRDIETAPKDGRRVLLWSEHWTGPACGIWAHSWTVGYDLPPYLYEPTHWQRLPDPPPPDGPIVGWGSDIPEAFRVKEGKDATD